jgi:glyoxylase-like metal-dependent hydrolase (beta-lactamase superfamily II)
MERVTDGVYQVKKGFRAFVVDGDEGVTLVDTGLPKRGGLVIDGLQTIGRAIEDVVSIVLTHSHVDHAGSAADLKARSGAELYCGSADAPAVRGVATRPMPPVLDRTPLQLLKPLFKLLPDAEAAEVDHEVDDGFTLKLPEDLRAVFTGGHTPGHTSYLLDRAGGILFVGDAASHRGGTVTRGWFNRPTPAIDQAVRDLAQLEFEIACFGHADPLTSRASDAFARFAAKL